ncbi:GNAT family N-acetyltransferase [Kutzneria buriramensis]|nr:GNAT family protein [Kutzneria buriramensis]
MRWPLRLPDELTDGVVSLRPYDQADSTAMFNALADVRAWEHIPHPIPVSPVELDMAIQGNLADGQRVSLTVRSGGRVVGMTAVLYDANDAAGVEVGGTQLDPAIWGTGVNGRAKRLLIAAIFEHGADWIRFRTDERNGRSAAAIRKLGARDLGVHRDTRVRRDGTQRRSRMFRLDRPSTDRDGAGDLL